ncbi:MAG: right-handed parallel beta-helix repeat-containing protein [Lentisphaeria bacterium]|nr:right-handed parallel beta-helix repeat-containing protein [Lentisphaeria bacterium]
MKRPTALFSLLFLMSGLVATTSHATRIEVVNNASQPALQKLMNSLAGEIDDVVILIPPGAWEMNGTVSISHSNVTILGAGPSRTRFFRKHEESTPFFRISKAHNVRFSGLFLAGNADPHSVSKEYGLYFKTVKDFRVDHCMFAHSGFGGVETVGETSGVVDHCVFYQVYKPSIANLGYGVVVFGTNTIQHVPYGSPRATFIEDSSFSGCRHAIASNGGARYVFRHNRVDLNIVAHAIDAHGHEFGSAVGTEWVEIYENEIANPGYLTYAMRIRGGGGLIWKNTVHGYATAIRLTESTDQSTGTVYIWGNTITGKLIDASPDTTPLPPANGIPSYKTSAPSNYVAYPYPHPLVTDLQARAGPDQVVMLQPGASEASVFLDGSASTQSKGSIVAYRWFKGKSLLSHCPRDVVKLPRGQHLILLEVQRSDGLVEHDLTVVRVVAYGPHRSSTTWNALWFLPTMTTGRISYTLSPSASTMDAYVGLTGRQTVASHQDNAIIIRTNPTGHFDARNGASYDAINSIPYHANTKYHVVVDVDLGTQRYSASVNGKVLATKYAFRKPVTSISQLTTWHATGILTTTSLTVSGKLAKPDPACHKTPAQDAGMADLGRADSGQRDLGRADSEDGDSQRRDSGGAHTGRKDISTTRTDESAPPPEHVHGGCECRSSGNSGDTGDAGAIVGIMLLLFFFRARRKIDETVPREPSAEPSPSAARPPATAPASHP